MIVLVPKLSQNERTALLEEKGKIIVEPGEKYGLGGEEHIRINIGCPRSVLEEIFKQTASYVFIIRKESVPLIILGQTPL